MKQEEKLLRALGDVGDDLIARADSCRYGLNPWKRWGSLAASLALVVSLTALALPYLPMGCGSAEKSDGAVMEGEYQYTQGSSICEDALLDTECECETEAEPEEAPAAGETGQMTVREAAQMQDLDYLTDVLAYPLVHWQVGSFKSPADLSEDSLERLALAVEDRDSLIDGSTDQSEAFVRERLDRVLESYVYEPEDDVLPLDGALEVMPNVEGVRVEVQDDLLVLTVSVGYEGGTCIVLTQVTVRLEGDGWHYVSYG